MSGKYFNLKEYDGDKADLRAAILAAGDDANAATVRALAERLRWTQKYVLQVAEDSDDIIVNVGFGVGGGSGGHAEYGRQGDYVLEVSGN